MDMLVAILIPTSVLIYPPLQIFAVFKFRSFWRFLAVLPLLPMGYVLTVTIFAFLHESNVWPILFIFITPLALLYLILLA